MGDNDMNDKGVNNGDKWQEHVNNGDKWHEHVNMMGINIFDSSTLNSI